MKQYELRKMLEQHRLWLQTRLTNDVQGSRANLCGADLCGANLCGADLYGANLYGANLRRANLCGADLRDADLYGADLRRANLYGANLRDADLYGADLRRANLYGADLCGANLCGADLYGANLCGANLCGANLCDADLPIQCPEKGSFTGFKNAVIWVSKLKKINVIVELKITETAKRSSATTRKCRCSEAEVIDITSYDGRTSYEQAVSQHDSNFKYKKGETVAVDDFDENRWNECSTGIHFFITRQEAVDY